MNYMADTLLICYAISQVMPSEAPSMTWTADVQRFGTLGRLASSAVAAWQTATLLTGMTKTEKFRRHYTNPIGTPSAISVFCTNTMR
jgi:hypothetical protein